MEDTREFRTKGEILLLGGTRYIIESVEGCGGSSVVYRAVYHDELNWDLIHQVLVKELYPFYPRGGIYRDKERNICWTKEAETFVALSRMRFKQGNQVNLELLQALPSHTSGNLNSYEAYGTYYSVLTVHGGVNLKTVMEGQAAAGTLADAADIMMKILNALEQFHQNRQLHLDISPDNILLLPEQALLIDYSSIWSMKEDGNKTFIFSEKEGYSAPEIRLQDLSQIGYATDLYSVSAIFYQLLSGKKLTDHDLLGERYAQKLTGGLYLLQDAPKTAVHKAVQILRKGLHILSRKRYQSIEEMRNDLRELIYRIEGRGVSGGALWESSRRLYDLAGDAENVYLSQDIDVSGSGSITLRELYEKMKAGDHILLKGPGGMGKTRLLRELWRKSVKSYREAGPVVYYIPLKEYQETHEESFYIRKYILRHLCFSDKQDSMEDAFHELDRMFAQKNGDHVRVILLLDGLNEAGSRREKLLREIENLGDQPGVGILVTERTKEVQEYGLKMFQAAELLPLPSETVQSELESRGIPLPKKKDFELLLSNPMMLNLYEQVISMAEDNKAETVSDTRIRNADDLVSLYIQNLCTAQLRIDAGNQSMQLCHKYILMHLLPAIALSMTSRKRTLLSVEKLYQIVRKYYHNLKYKRFWKKYPEFLGKSRLMLDHLSEAEWFDFAVTEQLVENLGLLTKNDRGYYGLVHDNFQHCLAKWGVKNQTKMIGWFLPGYFVFIALVMILDITTPYIKPKPQYDDPLDTGIVKEYFLDIKSVYDVPIGIHSIKEEDLPQMNSYWTVTRKRDEIRSGTQYRKGMGPGPFAREADQKIMQYWMGDILYEDGKQACWSSDVTTPVGDFKFSYGNGFFRSEEGRYRVCSFLGYDSPDSVSLGDMGLYYGEYGEPQEDVFRLKSFYTEEGYTKCGMFLGNFTNVDTYVVDENGVAGLEFEHDGMGRMTGQYYLNQDMERISVKGVYKQEYLYDENNDLVVIAYRDEQSAPENGPEGWAYAELGYDGWHNRIEHRFYDREGDAAEGPEGAERVDCVYEQGNVTNVFYRDAAGKLKKNVWGYAVEEGVFENGYSVSLRFLDEMGELCENSEGFAEKTVDLSYDEENSAYVPYMVRYWDSKGERCLITDQYSGIQYEFTEDGILGTVTFLATDDKPCNNSKGYAVITGEDRMEEGAFRSVCYYNEDGEEVEVKTAQTEDGIPVNWK